MSSSKLDANIEDGGNIEPMNKKKGIGGVNRFLDRALTRGQWSEAKLVSHFVNALNTIIKFLEDISHRTNLKFLFSQPIRK